MISGPVQVLPSQTILGNATPVVVNTAAIPVYGAEQVDFKLKSTSAVAFGAEGIVHVSDDGVNWLSGSGQQIGVRVGTLNALAANNGITVTFAPSNGLRFAYRYARLVITGNGTGGQDITGLVVNGYAHFHEGIAKNVPQPLG